MPPPIIAASAGEAASGQPTPVMRSPKPALNDGIKPHVQQFDEGYGDIDPSAAAEAAAAAAAVHARYDGLIDAVRTNRGMGHEQKAAAISGLRHQQRNEAEGASAAIMNAATGAAASRREAMRRARQRPARQQDDPELFGATPLAGAAGSRADSRGGPTSGGIGQGFRAAALAVSRPAKIPPPKARRRGGDTRGVFGMAARGIMPRRAALPPQAYDAATAFLSDTLDWLNLWQDNFDCGGELDVSNSEQNYLSPHL